MDGGLKKRLNRGARGILKGWEDHQATLADADDDDGLKETLAIVAEEDKITQ